MAQGQRLDQLATPRSARNNERGRGAGTAGIALDGADAEARCASSLMYALETGTIRGRSGRSRDERWR